MDNTADAPLAENKGAEEALLSYTSDLKLATAKGEKTSEWTEKVNGASYVLCENPMGIKKVSLEFGENEGKLHYTNAQGDKTLTFGMCENAFGLFPEEGYSDEVGTVYTPGNYYKCAASGAWVSPNQLFIKVQIIDKYFGNLNIMIGFKDTRISIYMNKAAEAFLNEYDGYAGGEMEV